MSDPPAATGCHAGQSLPRYEARGKVSGATVYAADEQAANALHGHVLTSTIARGRIESIDTAAAEAMPGVVRIYTHRNAPARIAPAQTSDSRMPLVDTAIHYAGEMIALIVAESLEIAREAARRIAVRYRAEPFAVTFDQPGAEAVHPPLAVHKERQAGDFDRAYADAPAKIDAGYATPTQHHNPIELFSTTAVWDGDRLTVYEPSQYVHGLRRSLAAALGLNPAQIRVRNPFVGGAFGSKAAMTHRTALVAAAARELGRPVKLVLTRQDGFSLATYRAETRHRVRLGADASGKLLAYGHEGWEATSRADAYLVGGTENSVEMYAASNVRTRLNMVHLDRHTPGMMRAPSEMPYMFALESAMDELAIKLAMDPIELRRINDTMASPINGAPYTSRSLMQCYDQAAAAFGWHLRDPKPRSMRAGDWQIGYGCATASYPTYGWACSARIRLTGDARAHVEVAVHDLGTGAYTVVQQVAAEALMLDPANVTVAMGDTDLPPGPVAGGSMTTASVTAAVLACADKVRARFGGIMPAPSQLAAALHCLALHEIDEQAEWVPPYLNAQAMPALRDGAMRGLIAQSADAPRPIAFAFGAEFVEVRVHRLTREVRVPRMVGAFAAGHIVNPRTARSQYLGGMIWGMASALLEHTEIDERHGRHINDNLAEYLIAVNADVPEVEVILVPEVDRQVNPLGVKGIGELANVGTAAAVANAVYHATGKRIRDLPITMDKLFD